MKRSYMPPLVAGLAIATLAASSSAAAQTVLRASHQFPGGQGDVRDEMVQLMAERVADADVGLEVEVYPGQSLFKAREQWAALSRGRLDITALPLDYASGRHPEFSATLMPGLVRNHEHAQRLNDSKFMGMIKDVIQEGGARVLADAWLAGGFASSDRCITSPDTVEGQNFRAAGPAFEEMLEAAGASITSMPSSDIYTAMQTGVLDAANTSSMSFVSYRIYEQVECLTEPGEHACVHVRTDPDRRTELAETRRGAAAGAHGSRPGRRGVLRRAGSRPGPADGRCLRGERRRGREHERRGLQRLAGDRQAERLQELRRERPRWASLIDAALAVD